MGTQAPVATKVEGLQFKIAATDPEAPVTVDVRADEGIVEAIVSVTGIEDNVADIIEPGAYAETLTKRRPKVIWHHNWDQPIGQILHIEELMPGDSRLPAQTKDGAPWPKAAGGLLATMQFNLKSERGREAFEAVRFYSDSGECEWSIGYQVPDTKATTSKGVRRIKAIDLFEISYVLFGAATQTGTLGLKAAVVAAETRIELKGQGETVSADDTRVWSKVLDVLDDKGWSTWWAMQAAGLDNGGETKRQFNAEERRQAPTMPGTTSYPIKNLDDLDNAIQAWGRSKPADRAKLKRWLLKRARELNAAQDVIDRINKLQATGSKAAAVAPPVSDADMDDDGAVALAIAQASVDDDWETDDELDEDDLALVAACAAHEGKALTPGGREGDDSPVGTPGGRRNWLDEAGGLPRYVRMVAHALIRKGMDKSRAIATAVATMKRWAAGGGNVSAKVQAAAVKAVAEWETKKAKAAATKADPAVTAWSPWSERGQFASTKMVSPTSHREFPKLEGTFEERIAAVRSAVTDALQEDIAPRGSFTDEGIGEDTEAEEYESPAGGSTSPEKWFITIDGTWPDRVIATRCAYGDPGEEDKESFEMNYSLAEDGEVTLSAPEPVTLTVYVEPEDGDEAAPDAEAAEVPAGDMFGVPETVEEAVKALWVAHSMQTKAGRVLSGVNESRLKAAVASLIAVLQAAGIDLDLGKPGTGKPMVTSPDTSTTAKVYLPVGDVTEKLRELGIEKT